jgi:hypothetical protein
MQLDRQVVTYRNIDSPVKFQQSAETMQESLGIQPIDNMAKARPIWKRLYVQWSKQLLHV